MLKKKRSRRMPALFTTTSSFWKESRAHWTIRLAAGHSATLSVLAIALPPAARISFATFSAGPASRPSPCTEVPMSFTTTDAPAAPKASAKSRPMPPPAPVTSATFPSRSFNPGGRGRAWPYYAFPMLRSALDPRSVAVIGASDNPHKVGGRPILYMKRYGYGGAIYPVNPGRTIVQDLKAYPSIEKLPEVPELAIIAVAGDEAVAAVQACAARGVKVAVVMASGFGETGAAGLRVEQAMVETARRAGMRLLGPNCQGIANFATGTVANFSTIFHELGARDGPVAIVSQSGANSQAIYTLLHEKGLGVRHVHATGNEADVSVADLAEAVVADEGVRLVLLYLESVKDPARLAAAAAAARRRKLPIVALKAGRTASGQKA